MAGAKLAGAERILIVDPSAERRAKAVELGATDELEGGDDVVEQILELTGGFGTDYTFEATGLVAVMRQAVEAARMGWGQCVIAGVAGKGETLNVIPRYLITGRRIAGASFGGARGRDDVPGARAALPRRQAAARRVHQPPPAARSRQRRLRADARPGRHPHRPDVRLTPRLRKITHTRVTAGATNSGMMRSMPIAADYPFLNILWSMLIFVGFIMWIWLAIMVFMDIFRRRDIGGFAKAIWIIFIIFIPLLGVLVYLIAYHNGIADRNVKGAEAAQAAFDQQVKEAAGKGGPASEIATAQSLLDAGTISQSEFDHIKSKALAGG